MADLPIKPILKRLLPAVSAAEAGVAAYNALQDSIHGFLIPERPTARPGDVDIQGLQNRMKTEKQPGQGTVRTPPGTGTVQIEEQTQTLEQEGIEKPWTVKSKGGGDLYIRRVGNDAGKVFRKRQGPNDLAITFNQEALLPDYMYYTLQSLYPQLNARKLGTAQQAIKIRDVDEIITGHFAKE